ncbi:MAG: extracellular solute-binding protein [Roseburia sp.]|nr:extracellular solute-binding protein [Roseburia sp.]
MRHNKVKKRLLGVLAVLLLVAAAYAGAELWRQREAGADDALAVLEPKKETIVLWYTDDALTDYLNNKALDFLEKNDIRVEAKLVSGLEYLESINEASIREERDAPDVYIVSNDLLEKAYLSGLAVELADGGPVSAANGFQQAAVNAVTYDGKIVGCPLYFETSALLYNKTYLEQIAQAAAETEQDDGETADTAPVEGADDGQPITAAELIPSSIADILNFADSYSAPENVEYFFRWDVSDIFYNYFFIGNYISVGGDAGDDKSRIDIYNRESIASLKVYQDLNQFFSIDTKETTYDTILQEFLEGRTIYTIATSDCIRKLDEAAADGEFAYEYGIAMLPDINAELSTKGMSVTNALAVNGYSEHKAAANRFLAYLAGEASADLYDMTGKISAVTQPSYADAHVEAFMQSYAASAPIPKMIETSNFWIELEICFAKVWDGEDANEQIRTLSEKIKTQLAGEPVAEVVLEDPQVELLPATEYEDSGETAE